MSSSLKAQFCLDNVFRASLSGRFLHCLDGFNNVQMVSILYGRLKYFLDSLNANADADADVNADACLKGRRGLASPQKLADDDAAVALLAPHLLTRLASP